MYMTKSLSNKLYLKKHLYRLRMNKRITVLEHLNFFKKVINKLLAVDVKIDEEDKTLILLLAQRPSTLVLMMINSCSYVY